MTITAIATFFYVSATSLKKVLVSHFSFFLNTVIGVYGTKLEDRKVQIKMEHCALNGWRSQWTFEVKGRLRQKQKRKGPTTRSWSNILDLYPNAKVEVKHRNSIILTLDPPDEYHEFAVFGLPKEDDIKRMQMGLFGEKPVQGQEWKIWAILFDDTMMAFKVNIHSYQMLLKAALTIPERNRCLC